MSLSPEQKAAFRAQLDGRYREAQAARAALVTQHGIDGVAVWLASLGIGDPTPYPFSALPPECPWHFAPDTVLADALQAIWGQLSGKMPRLVPGIINNCRQLYGVQDAGRWFLAYVMSHDSDPGAFNLLLGGPPLTALALPDEPTAHGWTPDQVHTDLQRFYRVHDGFGEYSHHRHPDDLAASGFWERDASVVASHNLRTMQHALADAASTITMDDDAATIVQPADFLIYWYDMLGNFMGYWRERSATGYRLHDASYDHELHTVSTGGTFWDAVDEYLFRTFE